MLCVSLGYLAGFGEDFDMDVCLFSSALVGYLGIFCIGWVFGFLGIAFLGGILGVWRMFVLCGQWRGIMLPGGCFLDGEHHGATWF